MGDYTMQSSFDAHQQPVLQGVNALFSDFGSDCRPLDLDFAGELVFAPRSSTQRAFDFMRYAQIQLQCVFLRRLYTVNFVPNSAFRLCLSVSKG